MGHGTGTVQGTLLALCLARSDAQGKKKNRQMGFPTYTARRMARREGTKAVMPKARKEK
jgi:hypothetical protein